MVGSPVLLNRPPFFIMRFFIFHLFDYGIIFKLLKGISITGMKN